MNGREPGAVLDGKYQIVEQLASGGMGEVYLVRHVHLQELRVVKILRQDLAADPVAQKRFVREARLATQIKHPNVAILYDFSRLPEGSFYMVWEHIQGIDTGEWLRTHGVFSIRLAIKLAIQALRGLEAIHAAGIVHRDVSPDNLMIMENSRKQLWVKIIDLGLAKNLETDAGLEITQVGTFMGKLQYCSPEQASAANGMVLDRRTDIYSFALVLYEMVTGLPPFDSENQHGFIFKRLSEEPLSMIGRNPKVSVPVELDRLLKQALERDRNRRIPDAISFIQALERVEQGLAGVETREVVMPPDVRRPARPLAPAGPPRPRSSSELSREEKLELLAQIEKASRRAEAPAASRPHPSAPGSAAHPSSAGTRSGASPAPPGDAVAPMAPAATPASASAPAPARPPAPPGKAAPAEAPAAGNATVELQKRTVETEQVLAKYLRNRQLALARLALETLLELAPQHPNRADYESWVSLLAAEVEQEKRAEVALGAGRAALARRDFKAARHELEVVARNDLSGTKAEALSVELETAERGLKQGAEFEQSKRKIEGLFEHLRIEEAGREIEHLAELGVSRVTLDFYRGRLAEARAARDQAHQIAPLERRYRESLQARDWFAAREVAHELEKALPGPRSAAMFAEIERLEAIHQKQQAVEQAVREIDGFVARGDAGKAELALRILLHMDPENRHRKRIEKQIRALQRTPRG